MSSATVRRTNAESSTTSTRVPSGSSTASGSSVSSAVPASGSGSGQWVPPRARRAPRALPPAPSTTLSVMQCPSDGYARRPFNGSTNSGTSNMGDNWGRGCYAANAALGFMTNTYHSGVNAAAFSSSGGISPRPK